MLLFLVCLAVSSVVAIDLGDPTALYQNYVGGYAQTYTDYKPHDYEFGYGVSDPYTGDHKSQWEVKEQGVVRGGYSLLEPDGTTRVVEYLADDHGFRAVVKKIDQHGNAQVESHGNTDDHVVAAVAPIPPVAHVAAPVPHVAPLPQVAPLAPAHALQPIVAAEPIYNSYDGHVDNYIQNVEPVVVRKLAQPIEASYPVVQKAVYAEPQPIAVPQQYYQEPIVQQAPIIQKQIYAQAPIVQKAVSYAQQLPIVQKSVAYEAPIIQKEVAITPSPIPQYYQQEPVYNQVISKSPYVVDLNSYGPKSDAVFVQPKPIVYQQQQQQYEVPQPYYGEANLLSSPVAKGLAYEPQLSKQIYAQEVPQYVQQYQAPVKSVQAYQPAPESYYQTSIDYSDYSDVASKSYPISQHQLPYQQVLH